MEAVKIRWHHAMAEIPKAAWDRLAEPLETPLLEWTWLHELEASGSIAPANGWHPRHLTAWRGERLVGGVPLYLKQHSQGEFVFDQWWARWATQAGIAYYPKMVGMSPATPAVGYRFLIDEGPEGADVQEEMLQAIDTYCTSRGIAGLHLLFVDPQWRATLSDRDFLAWHHQSFLWRNHDCRSFDDYLRPFKSIQRRNIRRERSRIRQAGLVFQALSGDRIDPAWADTMFDYYLNTNAQYGPWAARYLNGEFFRGIFNRYRHRLLLMAACKPEAGDRPVALSLLMHKGNQLIGRYWGSAETIKDLHFSMCFYEPIQWAIDRGIRSFDPGAGSAHKLYRGFEAVANTSLHRFYEPNLRLLFQRFIGSINEVELANIAAMNLQLPFAARS